MLAKDGYHKRYVGRYGVRYSTSNSTSTSTSTLTHAFTYSLTRAFTYSLIQSITHRNAPTQPDDPTSEPNMWLSRSALNNTCIHIHTHTHSLTHSLTHTSTTKLALDLADMPSFSGSLSSLSGPGVAPHRSRRGLNEVSERRPL